MVAPLPDISIRQLEYLVAVADAPTWKAAATRVGVSASALSQGLAELERRIGVPLFESHGRRRVLRPTSEPVLDHARLVVSSTADVVDWARRITGAASGRVRLGMIDVAAVIHFPGVLRAVPRGARRGRPHALGAPSRTLLVELERGALDLVVCVEPPAPIAGIDMIPLLSEPLVIYAPPGVEIGPPSTWGPWVLFPADSHTRGAVAAALAARGAPIEIAAESHQPDVLREMVLLGLGWTVLPRSQGELGAADPIVGEQLLTRRLVLARRHSAVADPAVDELGRGLRRA